jgi:hypothetical protein
MAPAFVKGGTQQQVSRSEDIMIMIKGSTIAAAAVAVSAIATFVAIPRTLRSIPASPEAVSTDRGASPDWSAYSVSDYYGGEYDWPRLKLADPATRQSIAHDIVPQIESLTPDQLARLAKQEDFCSGPFSIKCFGIPTSKLRGYVEWALGRHSHNVAARFGKAAER